MTRINQINLSKNLILEALLKLLEIKDFDDISISEIASCAEVSRMTLYRHFKDKDDILLYGFDKFVNQVFEKLQELNNPTVEDLFILRFKLLKESPYTNLLTQHQKLVKLLDKLGSRNLFLFKDIWLKTEDEYLRSFLSGGIDAITQKWLVEGMVEPYEEVARRLYLFYSKFEL